MFRSFVVVKDSVKSKIEDNLKKYPELDLSIDFERAVRVNGHTKVSVTCNTCGDTKALHDISSLHTARYFCKQCSINKYKTLCNGINRTYIEHVPCVKEGRKTIVTTQVISTCNFCGTKESTCSSSVVAGLGVLCEPCLDKKYQEKAANAAATYVGRHTKKKLTFKCLAHGHLFDVTQDSAPDTKGKCGECEILEYTEKLSEKGCTLLEVKHIPNDQGKNLAKIIYKTPTEDVFSGIPSNIRKGQFATSSLGQWHTEHGTYLIHLKYNNNFYCKIGTAKNPQDRLQRLKLLGDAEVYTLAYFSDRFSADKLESELHSELKAFKLNRRLAEEFTTGANSVKRKSSVERVHVKDGVTEWYTAEVYDILKTRYNLTEGSANGS